MHRRVFAIADLHLSAAQPKPMDVFGPGWTDHAERVAASWRATVGPDDIVLVAGDISWAMKLPEAEADLAWIAALPGEKVFVRGNHDYWWQSITRVRRTAGARMHFIQNDVVDLDGIAVGGARLWDFPDVSWPVASATDTDRPVPEPAAAPREGTAADAEKIRAREIQRLRQSLSRLPAAAALRVALVHFPPVGSNGAPTALSEILSEFRIDLCVYGHVHSLGPDPRPGADCRIGSTRYVLASCDWLACRVRQVWPEESAGSS